MPGFDSLSLRNQLKLKSKGTPEEKAAQEFAPKTVTSEATAKLNRGPIKYTIRTKGTPVTPTSQATGSAPAKTRLAPKAAKPSSAELATPQSMAQAKISDRATMESAMAKFDRTFGGIASIDETQRSRFKSYLWALVDTPDGKAPSASVMEKAYQTAVKQFTTNPRAMDADINAYRNARSYREAKNHIQPSADPNVRELQELDAKARAEAAVDSMSPEMKEFYGRSDMRRILGQMGERGETSPLTATESADIKGMVENPEWLLGKTDPTGINAKSQASFKNVVMGYSKDPGIADKNDLQLYGDAFLASTPEWWGGSLTRTIARLSPQIQGDESKFTDEFNAYYSIYALGTQFAGGAGFTRAIDDALKVGAQATWASKAITKGAGFGLTMAPGYAKMISDSGGDVSGATKLFLGSTFGQLPRIGELLDPNSKLSKAERANIAVGSIQAFMLAMGAVGGAARLGSKVGMDKNIVEAAKVGAESIKSMDEETLQQVFSEKGFTPEEVDAIAKTAATVSDESPVVTAAVDEAKVTEVPTASPAPKRKRALKPKETKPVEEKVPVQEHPEVKAAKEAAKVEEAKPVEKPEPNEIPPWEFESRNSAMAKLDKASEEYLKLNRELGAEAPETIEALRVANEAYDYYHNVANARVTGRPATKGEYYHPNAMDAFGDQGWARTDDPSLHGRVARVLHQPDGPNDVPRVQLYAYDGADPTQKLSRMGIVPPEPTAVKPIAEPTPKVEPSSEAPARGRKEIEKELKQAEKEEYNARLDGRKPAVRAAEAKANALRQELDDFNNANPAPPEPKSDSGVAPRVTELEARWDFKPEKEGYKSPKARIAAVIDHIKWQIEEEIPSTIDMYKEDLAHAKRELKKAERKGDAAEAEYQKDQIANLEDEIRIEKENIAEAKLDVTELNKLNKQNSTKPPAVKPEEPKPTPVVTDEVDMAGMGAPEKPVTATPKRVAPGEAEQRQAEVAEVEKSFVDQRKEAFGTLKGAELNARLKEIGAAEAAAKRAVANANKPEPPAPGTFAALHAEAMKLRGKARQAKLDEAYDAPDAPNLLGGAGALAGGLNVEVFNKAFDYAVAHLQTGTDWVKALIDQFGETIVPYITHIRERLITEGRNPDGDPDMPGAFNEDTKQWEYAAEPGKTPFADRSKDAKDGARRQISGVELEPGDELVRFEAKYNDGGDKATQANEAGEYLLPKGQHGNKAEVIGEDGNFVLHYVFDKDGDLVLNDKGGDIHVALRDNFAIKKGKQYKQLTLNDVDPNKAVTPAVALALKNQATHYEGLALLGIEMQRARANGTMAAFTALEKMLTGLGVEGKEAQTLRDMASREVGARNQTKVKLAVKSAIIDQVKLPGLNMKAGLTMFPFKTKLSAATAVMGKNAAKVFNERVIRLQNDAYMKHAVLKATSQDVVKGWKWAKDPALDRAAFDFAQSGEHTPGGDKSSLTRDILRTQNPNANWADADARLQKTVDLMKEAGQEVNIDSMKFLPDELFGNENAHKAAADLADVIETDINFARTVMRPIRDLLAEQMARVPPEMADQPWWQDAYGSSTVGDEGSGYWPRHESQTNTGWKGLKLGFKNHMGVIDGRPTDPGAVSVAQLAGPVRVRQTGVAKLGIAPKAGSARQRTSALMRPGAEGRATESFLNYVNTVGGDAMRVEVNYRTAEANAQMIGIMNEVGKELGDAGASLVKLAEKYGEVARDTVGGILPGTSVGSKLLDNASRFVTRATAEAYLWMNPKVLLTIMAGGTAAGGSRAGAYAMSRGVTQSILHGLAKLTPGEMAEGFSKNDPANDSMALKAALHRGKGTKYDLGKLWAEGDTERASMQVRDKINDVGFYLIGHASDTVAKTVWRAFYDDAVRSGKMSHEDAVVAADKTFNEVVPRNPATRPRIYNSTGLTPFVQFSQDQLDMLRDLVASPDSLRPSGKRVGIAGKIEGVATIVGVNAVINAISYGLFGGASVMNLWGAGVDSKEAIDDEELTPEQKALYAASRFGGEILAQVPGVSTVGHQIPAMAQWFPDSTLSGLISRDIPVASIFNDIFKSLPGVASGDPESGKRLLLSAGGAVGFPVGQTARTIEGLKWLNDPEYSFEFGGDTFTRNEDDRATLFKVMIDGTHGIDFSKDAISALLGGPKGASSQFREEKESKPAGYKKMFGLAKKGGSNKKTELQKLMDSF